MKYLPLSITAFILFLSIPAWTQHFDIMEKPAQHVRQPAAAHQDFHPTSWGRETTDPVQNTGSNLEYLLDSTLVYLWSPSSGWINYIKRDFAYDDFGKRTDDWIDYWMLYEWANNTWYKKLYDSEGKQIEEIRHNWVTATNGWVYKMKYVHVYNGNAYPEETIYYKWNPAINDWELDYRNVLTYNPAGQLIEWVQYDFTTDWQPKYRYVYTYNMNGDLSIETATFFEWDTASGTWNMSTEAYTSIEVVGNTREEISYSRDMVTGEWIPQFKRAYQTESDGRFLQVITYQWNNEWELSLKQDYYWSQHDIISGTDRSHALSCRMYPNPVKDQLFIDGLSEATEASIYSVQGNLLQKSKLTGETCAVNVRDLPAGVYLIHLQGGGRKAVLRFIK